MEKERKVITVEESDDDYDDECVEEREEKWIEHYSSSQRILLVGEGNFSFSLSLAKAFASAINIVATSLDTQGMQTNN